MANVVKIVKGAVKAATKKKPSLKQAHKAKPLADTKPGVKVLPRKSAPKSDLSNRGKKLTRAERSERAQDYKFDKSLDSYYKGIDDAMGGEYYMYKTNLRGPGKANARKAAAIKKEGKSVVKINSQQNLKKKK